MRTRREFLRSTGGVTGGRLTRALPVGVGALLWPRRVEAGITLNTFDPSNFTSEGGQQVTNGTVLTLNDRSVSDFVAFFAKDPDAAAGNEVDVVATFQVRSTIPVNAEVGNRVVISDGQTRSAIAACIIKNGVKGIGLLAQGSTVDPASYPVFVPVDWQAAPVTIRLRRSAAGDAELVEVNGVAPSPRALLTFDQLPGPTRGGFGSVEFGCASVEATCTVEYSAFRSERVVTAVAGSLVFTRFRIRDTDSADRLAFRADFHRGLLTNGIDPATEPVTINLSTTNGPLFYSQTLNGFTLRGKAPRRRWVLNDAELLRTGFEQLVIDEDPSNTRAIVLRDTRTELFDDYFGNVTAAITIGAGALGDKLTGAAQLVEGRPGSGRWRLHSEP